MHLIDTSIWLDFFNKKSEVELAQRVQELMATKYEGCQVFHNDKHFDWLVEIAAK